MLTAVTVCDGVGKLQLLAVRVHSVLRRRLQGCYSHLSELWLCSWSPASTIGPSSYLDSSAALRHPYNDRYSTC